MALINWHYFTLFFFDDRSYRFVNYGKIKDIYEFLKI